MRKLKYLYQRLTRGWDDTETWNLDYCIAKFALPRLKRFKEFHNGFPPDITEEEWNKYLDKMIYAMQVEVDENKPDFDYKEIDWEKFKEGTFYFGTYFRHLWW